MFLLFSFFFSLSFLLVIAISLPFIELSPVGKGDETEDDELLPLKVYSYTLKCSYYF